MRTNDGTLAKQQWLWDQPYESGSYWDSMRDSITSNLDPQPLADDLSDGYIADRLHWDSMDADPACPCSPTVMDSKPDKTLEKITSQPLTTTSLQTQWFSNPRTLSR